MALYKIQIHLTTYLDTYIRNQMEKKKNKLIPTTKPFWLRGIYTTAQVRVLTGAELKANIREGRTNLGKIQDILLSTWVCTVT